MDRKEKKMVREQIWDKDKELTHKLQMDRIFYKWIDKSGQLSDREFKEQLKKIKGKKWFEEEFPSRFYQIRKEIPVMVNQQGNLVTIPHTRDPVTFGICGKRGSGKTVMLNSLCGRMYWYWKNSGFPNFQCGLINDINNETGAWSAPSDFKTDYLYVLDEIPAPLPIVKLYPTTKTLRILDSRMRGIQTTPYLEIGLPFVEFLKNPQDFINLGKSATYFLNIKEALLGCNTIQECFDVINGSAKEIPFNTRNKIKSALAELWDRKIFDISTDAISQIKITQFRDKKKYTETLNPFIALMVSNLIPSIQSRDLQGKFYSDKYFDYIMNDVFNRQYEGTILGNKHELMFFVDELNAISSKENTKATVQRTIVESRSLRLGMCWCSQNPTKIAERIFSNTKYMACLQNSKKEINKLGQMVDLTESQRNQVMNFNPFEVLLITSGVFHVYDPLDNLFYETKEPQIGKILTPLSHSQPPTK